MPRKLKEYTRQELLEYILLNQDRSESLAPVPVQDLYESLVWRDRLFLENVAYQLQALQALQAL